MKSNRFWILTFAIIFAACAVGAWLIASESVEGDVAIVTWDGNVVHTIDLSRHGDVFDIHGVSIAVENNDIHITHADCPDQLCVERGWLRDGLTPIVCLPNRVVIYMAAESDHASGFDAVSS